MMKSSRHIICLSLALSALAGATEPTAEELLAYANALSVHGKVVKAGGEGITINGEILNGLSARRPSAAICRAAELTMEKAISSRDQKGIDEAFSLWKRAGSDTQAIPYLRMAG